MRFQKQKIHETNHPSSNQNSITPEEFTASLSHEIATPLTSIRTNLEIMQSSNQSSIFVQRALLSIEQIDLIINNYLSLGKRNHYKTWFDPTESIQKALEVLSGPIKQNNIRIEFFHKNANIYGNEIEFIQVATNLIKNSIDAYIQINQITNNGTKIIKISSLIFKHNYLMKILDYGIGVKKEDQANIFQPFFSTKPEEFGTGLGLAVSKRIIEEGFSGSLELANLQTPTEFLITIPQKSS